MLKKISSIICLCLLAGACASAEREAGEAGGDVAAAFEGGWNTQAPDPWLENEHVREMAGLCRATPKEITALREVGFSWGAIAERYDLKGGQKAVWAGWDPPGASRNPPQL